MKTQYKQNPNFCNIPCSSSQTIPTTATKSDGTTQEHQTIITHGQPREGGPSVNTEMLDEAQWDLVQRPDDLRHTAGCVPNEMENQQQHSTLLLH